MFKNITFSTFLIFGIILYGCTTTDYTAVVADMTMTELANQYIRNTQAQQRLKKQYGIINPASTENKVEDDSSNGADNRLTAAKSSREYLKKSTAVLISVANAKKAKESSRLEKSIDVLEKRQLILENQIEARIVARPGGCPEGNPCPKIGTCIDIEPTGDGVGWNGESVCSIDLEK